MNQVFLVLADVPDQDVERLVCHVRASYGFELRTISAELSSLDGYFVSGQVTTSTYLRLHLGELLPISVTRVLYLDSDTLVVDDLTELVDLEMINEESRIRYLIGAVPAGDVGDHLIELGFTGNGYFNAGVLWIDLQLWRERKVGPELVSLASRLGNRLHFWDQDVLNLFFDQSWFALDTKFNWVEKGGGVDQATVIHFLTGDKPWLLGNRHPAKHLYRYYRSLTPFPYRSQWDLWNLYRNWIPPELRHLLHLAKRQLRALFPGAVQTKERRA